MFWGLLLEPGKRYSTTVEKSFHVSKAALHCSSVRNENEIISVILETEGSEALLCNLCKQRGILQETLDLNFMTGDRLTFECRGHGKIHLTGYLLPDEEDDMSVGMLGDEESEEEEESGWPQPSSPEKGKKAKRKPDGPPEVPPKKKKSEAGDDDEEESDSEGDEESDMSDAGLDDEDLDDEEMEDEDSDKDEDEESDDEEDDDANLSQKKKQKQQQKPDKNKTPNKQNLDTSKKSPVTNGISPKEQKSNKKTSSENKSPNATPQQKKVLDQGVVVKELKIGTGPPAKPGRMVSVYYVGKLKDGQKIFDKQLKGEGFKFKLGKGEVIKGWDIGLQGMKVGGKRIIHCPPETAYGAKGVPPKIPANSSLLFEVELKAVH